MKLVPLVLPLAAISALVTLAGCSSQPTAAATAPAPAPTVTMTATAARTADSPIDAIDAWYFCRSEVYKFAFESKSDPFTANDFDLKFVTESKGSFIVQIAGENQSGAKNSVYCVVQGTVGNPTISDYQYPR